MSSSGSVTCWITQLKAYHNDKKRTGIVRWHGPLLGDGRLLLVSTDGDLTDVDAETGETRSHINIGKDMSLPPVAAAGILYILTDEGRIIAYK